MVYDKLCDAKRMMGVAGAAVMLLFAIGPSSALAEAPVWSATTSAAPTNIPPGGEGELIVRVTNLGDSTADGVVDPTTITDTLPPSLVVTAISGANPRVGPLACDLVSVSCISTEEIPPYGLLELKMRVKTISDAPSRVDNQVTVSGGGAAEMTAREQIAVTAKTTGFGVEKLAITPTDENGAVDTQAGSHPFQLTTTVLFNNRLTEEGSAPIGMVKDLHFQLPPGLIGNPEVVPRCTDQQFSTYVQTINECPENTAIGVVLVMAGGRTLTVPLFNLVPAVGEPARFGFEVGTRVVLDTAIRTGGDYGVTVSVTNISQLLAFEGSQVTFWGVPADSRHDQSRGWHCLYGEPGCATLGGQAVTPFLTLPTSCTGPIISEVFADRWEEPNEIVPGEYTLQDGSGRPLGMQGCDKLHLDPSISAAPDGEAASSPSGLTVGIHVPQESTLNPTGLAESSVRDTRVALPEGIMLNPAAADGLLSCSTGEVALEASGSSSCPEAAKVGTVTIRTPLLSEPLEGAVYLAAQDANPFGSLVALYIVGEDPRAGVVVKLAGEVALDEHTGQIVSTFKATPQLPFEDLKLHFFGGSRAPLSTPALCGDYTTVASISPWSGNPATEATSKFNIRTGPSGSPCQSPLPFAPSLTAGSTNIQSGAFTPFTMTMSREDGQQNLDAISLHMPPGLLGTLSSVGLCDEADANAGTCAAESLIGHTIVSVGLGGDPYSVTGGRVFITGPYEGAPYGLSIVNPAKAGPFDLGTVVVRAKIEVDPITATLTITTDSSGPYAIPQILKGIPLQIKHVNVTIDRAAFTFNPTSCEPMAITGSLTSSQGADSTVDTPFQVTNCATLGFRPQFKVSTQGKTSRANGASLDVKLTYPKARFGSQANIKSVKVDLPKQLPSRLNTLQQACPDRVFDVNPAACAAGSRIGSATATTPVIPVSLSGPAYFVSHGGLKFPELVVVLSGYGVTVDLHGETFINSITGVTSSTFRQIPDVPIGSFELKLPEGRNSALAANVNLCAKSKLTMPTAFTAQNGLVIHQSTPIGVTGCAKHKVKKARKSGSHSNKNKKK